MIRTFFQLFGLAVAVLVGLIVLGALSLAGNIYVFQPMKHSRNVAAAERQNLVNYQSGKGYVFEIKFSAEVTGTSSAETRQVVCYPKNEAQLTFKSGAMTWDMLNRKGPEVVDVKLLGGRTLTFDSKINCSILVHSYNNHDQKIDAGSKFRAELSTLITGDSSSCNIHVKKVVQTIGELIVHAPEVINAAEVPVSQTVSREEYGPADRGLFKEISGRKTEPRPIEDSHRFYWQEDALCWESSKDMISRIARSSDGAYRGEGEPICSEQAADICGFP